MDQHFFAESGALGTGLCLHAAAKEDFRGVLEGEIFHGKQLFRFEPPGKE